MRYYFSGLLLISLLSGCSVFGINSVEEASYDAIHVEGDYELRLYQPMVIAETYVEGEFDAAGDIAFNRLFDYISRDNISSSKIAMTAPVIVDQSGSDRRKKIGMTVPVLEQRKDQGWRYMFVLPAAYTIKTAPAPLDEKVKLSSMPQKKVAVLRFSGLRDELIISQKTLLLEQWIAAKSWTPASEPRWAGYNPPWTLPFYRRNEVMIDIH